MLPEVGGALVVLELEVVLLVPALIELSLDIDPLGPSVVLLELLSKLAFVLLIERTDEHLSRSMEARADALPTPLTLPETLAAGDEDSLQVTRTLSPLLMSFREASAFASTLSVRGLAAPEVASAGFKVIVRADWSADTTSAVTVLDADEEVLAVDDVVEVAEPVWLLADRVPVLG
jgi:hypothetical protein